MIYLIFFYSNDVVFQIIWMNIMNVLVLNYHGLSEPFLTRQARRLDYFNEACLGLISYFLFMYSDFVLNEEIKYNIGWVQVGVFALNEGVNSFGVLFKILRDTALIGLKKFRQAKRKL